MIEDAKVETCFIPTNEMHADFLTKNLPRLKFKRNIMAIKLIQNCEGKLLENVRLFQQ